LTPEEFKQAKPLSINHKIRKVFSLVLSVALLLVILPMANVEAAGEPGQIDINKTSVASGNREYTVELTVKGNGLTTAKPADIVLVLDVSLSMNDRLTGTKTRLQVLKEAATTFVSTVLAGGDNRVAVVTYSTDVYGSGNWNDGRVNQAFSNSASTINSTINGLSAVSYTNMEAGYYHADAALDAARAGVDKFVIFMTDGVPNRYYSDTGATLGSGSDFSVDAANQAIGAAETLKATHSGTKIFTIGLVNDDPIGQIASVLNPPSPHNYPEAYYQVTTASGLSGIYAYLSQTILQIASDAVVTDMIEHGFSYISGSLSYPAGTSAAVSGTPATGELVTWTIGAVSEDLLTLTFRVHADDPVYGGAFTNQGAELVFKPVPGNTFYTPGGDGTVSLTFPRPVVPVPPIAVDDAYSVSNGDTLVIAAPGVLVNDISVDQRADGGWTSTPISGSVSVVGTGPLHGTLTQNADGSLTYTPEAGFAGVDTYDYKIYTDVTVAGGGTSRLEDTATVTITVSPDFWIRVHKTDSGAAEANLAGVVFDLYDAAKVNVLERLPETDADGLAQTAAFYSAGSYYLKEVSAPAGYVIDDSFHPVTVLEGSGTLTVDISNSRIPYPIGVYKVDSGSSAPLAGVVFNLYSDAAGTHLLATLPETDQAGYAQTAATFAPGTYYLQEQAAPTGYLADNTLYPVVVNVGQKGGVATITVRNTAIGRIDIPFTKTWVDSENIYQTRPTAGITVHLWRMLAGDAAPVEVASHTLLGPDLTYTFGGQLATNNVGEAYIYSITEDVLPNYSTQIDGFAITNTLDTVDKTVSKVWVDDGNAAALRPSLVEIQLMQNGVPFLAAVQMNGDPDWTHAFNGLPAKNPAGEPYTYTVVENTVTPAYTTSYNQETLTITNTLVKYRIQVLKLDQRDGQSLLQGAVFELHAANLADQVLSVGALLETLTTDVNGSAVTTGFYAPGNYYLVETSAPAGFHPITEPIQVTIAAGSGSNGLFTVRILDNFDNNPSITIGKKAVNLSRGSGVPADLADLYVGETAQYSLVITNNGNATLQDVILTDDLAVPGSAIYDATHAVALTWQTGAGGIATINLGALAVGQSISLTYSYIPVKADLAREPITNTATVTGRLAPTPDYPDGTTVSGSDSAVITVTDIPLNLAGISISKKVQNVTRDSEPNDLAAGYVGDTFRFTVVVTNSGSLALANVILTDDRAPVGGTIRNVTTATNQTWTAGEGGIATLAIGSLAVGQTITYTYEYTSTSADANDILVNTAVVEGTIAITLDDPEVVIVTDQSDATVAVDQIPLTGETNAGGLIGIGLLLAAATLAIFRKRWTGRDLQEHSAIDDM
jgi:uncharacterized repeat protein (TIGR01451 family)/LPXTG-motif cell wall-anchored protein